MPTSKYVNFPFTARRIELAQLMLADALGYMAAKKSTATAPAEVDFYEKQSVQFQALVDLLAARAAAVGACGATLKIRLTEEQFRILSGGIGHRNLTEMRAINARPAGADREQRTAAYDEWEAFATVLEDKDPRKYDTSQDAAEDEDEAEADAEATD